MKQVKIFKTIEAEISALEADVNRWLRDSGADVISITGNIAAQSGNPSGEGRGGYVPSDVLLVVLYDDGKLK